MAKNPEIAIIQLEGALNTMQNTMIDEDGKFTMNDKFFEIFDDLMSRLQETRKIAQSYRKSDVKNI